MIKRFVLIIVIVLVAQILFSIDFDYILNSNQYYAGMGKAETYEKANKKALKDLVTKISTSVEINYENVYSEEDGNIKEFTQTMVSTYSNTMLNNTYSKVKEDESTGIVTVVRYVERENLEEVFKARAIKVKDYYHAGLVAEDELRIGDALRYYYWSLILLRSHPDNNVITVNTGDKNVTLLTLLPVKIEQIFTQLQFSILCNQLTEDRRSVTVGFRFNDQPVENIDISYYTGDSWSTIISCNNGKAILDFYDAFAREMENFDIKVDFAYYNKRNIDAEIRQILEELDNPSFRESRETIYIKDKDENGSQSIEPQTSETMQELSMEEAKIDNALEVSEEAELIDKVMVILSDVEPNREFFTDDGFEQINRIIQYGNARIIKDRSRSFIMKSKDETTIRSIPVQLSFPNNNRNFTENINVILDKEGKIKGVNFALGDRAVEDILNRTEAWGTEENKYQIIQFMEYYKTAYCMKNLDFIESVFADNALIIVGNVLKEDKPIENMYKNLRNIEYVRLSKQEYVERLENVFKSNEFVNIGFEENSVKKVNGDDKIYGIQIAQNYWSSSYADKGYLFLMIDLNDANEPRIYVRSWQPEKNPDGSIIGLSDFQLY